MKDESRCVNIHSFTHPHPLPSEGGAPLSGHLGVWGDMCVCSYQPIASLERSIFPPAGQAHTVQTMGRCSIAVRTSTEGPYDAVETQCPFPWTGNHIQQMDTHEAASFRLPTHDGCRTRVRECGTCAHKRAVKSYILSVTWKNSSKCQHIHTLDARKETRSRVEVLSGRGLFQSLQSTIGTRQ